MVNFKHEYDKLKIGIFPTIRSTNYMGKHGIELNDIVEITTPNGKRTAQLIYYEDMAIKDIPLSFLIHDAAPMPITSHEDFIELLNSFLPIGWGHNSINTIKRILWFRWVR